MCVRDPEYQYEITQVNGSLVSGRDRPFLPIAFVGYPPASAMDVAAFVEKWSASGASERANKDLFLAELCDVLGVPRPECHVAGSWGHPFAGSWGQGETT
ncbi:hypothetical protein [Sorangium sp. So ce1335]|uniref:hypothetical protein n=1 Tax=Sorangium sp. So ce1335 TaxID=3133335 RepID=UPI003F63C5E6